MMRRRKKVTLQDLADELNLTIHTVSKALRGLPGMSQSTRRLVFDKARELGYQTKEQELSLGYEKVPLLVGTRRRFAMAMASDSPFFRLQLQGVQERLHEMGHTVAVVYIPQDVVESEHRFDQWLEASDLLYYDGLFIPPAIPEHLEQSLLQLPLPKIMINYAPPLAKADSVIWDIVSAVHQCVDYLAQHGHRRILYIGDIHRFRGFALRWHAFAEAMSRFGVYVKPSEHLTRRSDIETLTIPELQAHLSRDDYTAVLCGVEQDLTKLYYSVEALGKSIPTDVSLISIETLNNPQYPMLTRPTLLVEEAGRRAAERMLWRIANPNHPYESVRLQGDFIEGDTVRRVK